MRVLSLITLLLLGTVTHIATAATIRNEQIITDKVLDNSDSVLKDDAQFTNAYQVSVTVHTISQLPVPSAFVRFEDGNSTKEHPDQLYFPSSVTGSGPFQADFVGDSARKDFGVFVQQKDVLNNAFHRAFAVYVNSSGAVSVAALVNLTEEIATNFPDTAGLNPIKLWPDHSYDIHAFVNGISVFYTINYKGVTDVFGNAVDLPIWKFIAAVIAVDVSVALIFASIDSCRQPVEFLSSSGLKNFFGNFIWLVFGGLFPGVLYLLVGAVLFCTIVLTPFGLKLIEFGTFALFPFGREIKSSERNFCSFSGNMIWLFLGGFGLAVTHFLLGITLCILLITIPFGLQHLKLAKHALMPFGHSVEFKPDLGRIHATETVPLHHDAQSPRYV